MQTTLRPATPADQPFLEALFHAAHQHEFAPLNLPEPQLTALLQMQARAQRTSYAANHPQATDSIILSPDSTPIGRLYVDRQPNRINLIDINLTPQSRGHGIGTTLIKSLIEEAAGTPIRLQVRPENPAFRLYTRLGFRLIGAGMQLELEHGTPAPEPTPTPIAPNPWDPFVGTVFDVLIDPPSAAPQLLLDRIEPHPTLGPRYFSLIFLGPLQPQLPQGLLALHHPHAPAPESHLFLVPIGPEGQALQYEAVFN